MNKNNKKAITFILMLAMVVTMFLSVTVTSFADDWDGSSSSTAWSGSGTSADPYRITNAAELRGLAVQVNSGVSSYGGICFELTSDINLANNAWTPILS